MRRLTRRKKVPASPVESGALFLGTGVRAIVRKTMLPGYTVSDLEQFLTLLYGMFDEKEAKQVHVYDPFAQGRGRRVTVARLADALIDVIERNAQKSA